MTTKRDHLTKAETVTVVAIEQGVPMLGDARALVDRFHEMIRKKAEIELEPWIDESKRSLIASFATGIANDKGAVHAAITQPWSNGQVEAQITKLKLVKCQMYGRAKLDLLQARLIGAPRNLNQSPKLRQTPNLTLRPAACSQACAVLPEFLRYGLGARGALSRRC